MTAEAEDEEYKKQLEEMLKAVNKKLEERKILIDTSQCANESLSREQKENHAFSLTIPNECYILWENKMLLQKKLDNDVPTFVGMMNDSLKRQLHIKASASRSVEERVHRKSMR